MFVCSIHHLVKAKSTAASLSYMLPEARKFVVMQALHRLAPKRRRSLQPKVELNPRKYRCGCSNERPTSEPSPDNADPQESKQRSEAKPSASSSQEQDRRHAEMYEMLKKTIRGAPGGSARQELPLSYMWKKDLKKLGQALPL